MKHYLANQRAKANAGKRGGGQVTLPLEFDLAEQRYQHEPVDTVSPDTLCRRASNASAVIETVLRPSGQWTARGKSSEFDRLRETLTGDSPSEGYAAIAVELGTTEPALRVAAHRLKRRFLTELPRRVADLSSPADVDEEPIISSTRWVSDSTTNEKTVSTSAVTAASFFVPRCGDASASRSTLPVPALVCWQRTRNDVASSSRCRPRRRVTRSSSQYRRRSLASFWSRLVSHRSVTFPLCFRP